MAIIEIPKEVIKPADLTRRPDITKETSMKNPAFLDELRDWLVGKLKSEPAGAESVFEAVRMLEMWRATAEKLQVMSFEPAEEVALVFQSHWLTYGHRIRKQISDDRETVGLLKQMMPKYQGTAKTLYRGEKRWNWDYGTIGFCWTDKLGVAETFAGGFHNGEEGAVVIKGEFPAFAIIAGPEPKQTHDIRDREREFTIDPFCDVIVEAIDCHGTYDDTGNHRPRLPLPGEVKRRCQR